MTSLKKNILLVGLIKTSLTESLEAFLTPQATQLGVIGIMSPFAPKNDSQCLLYEDGVKKKSWSLPAYVIRNVTWWNYPFMLISYLVYIYSYIYSIFLLRRRFEIFIGVSTFSAMFGLFLKKIGLVQIVIYYCLDYYPDARSLDFRGVVNFLFRKIEPFLVKNADVTWELSPKITVARKKYLHCIPDKKVYVPVGYPKKIMRCISTNSRKRYEIGFIGSLSVNQGLQMVAESIPTLQELFPKIKVHIIGHGTYAATIRKIVKELGVDDVFVFHGFLSDQEKAYNILSRCAMGIAPYTGGGSDNAVFTEPGKPKLYILLGLPIIITENTQISKDIERYNAGIRIKYSKKEFIKGVIKMLQKDSNLEKFYAGVQNMQPYCTSEMIYEQAFKETMLLFDK